jgi:glycerophosphoryl diester phosphodiesterase
MPLNPMLFSALLVLPFFALVQSAFAAADTEPRPLVIAHRGASGYVPEHTLAAYSIAILQGADYIEVDLVPSQDGQLFVRHDNELGLTTDVAQHPEFAGRKRQQRVDGVVLDGWFSEDFTAAELKRLRAIERIPQIRPGNTRLNGQFEIPTLQQVIDLVKALELSQGRQIGLYIETKHPTHFSRLGLGIERQLLEVLARNGYRDASAPVYIQSFEVSNLQTLHQLSSLRLIQLYDVQQPYDQVAQGNSLSYAQMATAEGLKAVAQYAAGVGPDRSYILAEDERGQLAKPSRFVADAHAAGLLVHPYTFRAENHFLPASLQRGQDPAAQGDIQALLRAFLDAGVDGLFIDQPDIAVGVRNRPR